MIPESTALARLAHERQYWKKTALRTDYAQGVMDGLQVATRLIGELWEETREQFKHNPNYLAACISRCAINVKRSTLGGRYEKRKAAFHKRFHPY
jgi:S-methylmethionine-dependent homocysteine/selenocysteine methylase